MQAEYEDQKSKRPPYLAIAGGVTAIILLLGTCTWGFSGLFKDMSTVSDLTTETAEDFLTNGLPEYADTIYSPEGDFTAESIELLEDLLVELRPIKSVDDPSCNANFNYSTNELSGRFVSCLSIVTFDQSSGRLETVWRFESEDWRLLKFYVHIDDAGVYRQAIARSELRRGSISEDDISTGD